MLTIESINELKERELDKMVCHHVYGKDVVFCKGIPTGWKVDPVKDEKGNLISETRTPIVWTPNDYIFAKDKLLGTIPWPHKYWGAMEEVVAYMKIKGYYLTLWEEAQPPHLWFAEFCPDNELFLNKKLGLSESQKGATEAVCKAALVTLLLNNELREEPNG